MTYLLDNAHTAATTRFAMLGQLYDRHTANNLAPTIGAGACGLEVGAGNGSVAVWMSNTAGPAGQVTVTDLDTRWVDLSGARWPGQVTVLQHDATRDPFPGGPYDVVHARLVLMHLPERDQVLRTLVGLLRPGGWLAVEELDPVSPYQPDPVTPADHLVNRVGDAFTAALERRGANNTRGRNAHRILERAGLVDVHNEGHVVVATGCSPAAQLMQANVTQTAGDLDGITTDDVTAYVAALNDPGLTFYMPTFFAARGRKP